MPSSEGPLFLGIDLSTQQLKAVVVDSECVVVCREAVNFERDFPVFRTKDGVCREGQAAWSPVQLWLAAFDSVIEKLSASVELSRIAAISGTAQMHGTVYWCKEGEEKLAAMSNTQDVGTSFYDDLMCGFARDECPIWMDSSTGEYVDKFDRAIPNLNEVSGSTAYHRFSGPQIAKIYKEEREVYDNTSRISLVSSFAASLLLGRVAPIDLTDACGMNILDIRKQDWSDRCLEVVVDYEGEDAVKGLRTRLGVPIPANTILGTVNKFLVAKHGFSPDCKIVSFTGDNMSSMADLNVVSGDVVLSLGTSDTVNFLTESFIPRPFGHLLIHPTTANSFLTLICYKNGSLTRERIRKSIGVEWEGIGQLLLQTDAGNGGHIGIFLDMDEIEPRVPAGDYRWDPEGRPLSQPFPPAVEARALLEGQVLHLRSNTPTHLTRVIVTGGASNNCAICQVIADVFGLPVFKAALAESATLGGAKRAKYAFETPSVSYAEYFNGYSTLELVAKPNPAATAVYVDMLQLYEQREQELVKAVEKAIHKN